MQDIPRRLSELEPLSRQLEPTPQERQHWQQAIHNYSEEFLDKIHTSPTFRTDAGNGSALEEMDFPGTGLPAESIMDLFKKHVGGPGLNAASPGHFAYIPGGGLYHSALGDYLADVSNRYAGIYFASPGAVRLEQLLMNWMREIFGLPDTAGGTLTSGGSIANLTAIVTARDAKGIKSALIPQSVIYLTQQVHHCVAKALRIAGLGEAIVRYLPLDERFRMDVSALKKQVESDLAEGLRPWLVVASTGTTDTGAVDPLDEIAPICREHDLWLHADAAYGGFFLLVEEGREVIKGMDLVDSVVMDPHKGLFLPYGTGALLVRDKQLLIQSHHYQANYMQDALRNPEEVSPADMSPELSRHFRGMRMWLPLIANGLAPFEAALSEKIWLCRYFYERIRTEIPRMELGPEPELSVCVYRYLPEQGDPNEFNEKLVREIHEDGRLFLSSTLLNGNFWIRLAVLSFRSHKDTVDLAIEVLKEKIAFLENE